jgi:hypothetical protein
MCSFILIILSFYYKMPFFNFIENLLFISLGITFVLILFLFYHFTQRISSLEQKTETMFGIVSSIIKELKFIQSTNPSYGPISPDVEKTVISLGNFETVETTEPKEKENFVVNVYPDSDEEEEDEEDEEEEDEDEDEEDEDENENENEDDEQKNETEDIRENIHVLLTEEYDINSEIVDISDEVEIQVENIVLNTTEDLTEPNTITEDIVEQNIDLTEPNITIEDLVEPNTITEDLTEPNITTEDIVEQNIDLTESNTGDDIVEPNTGEDLTESDETDNKANDDTQKPEFNTKPEYKPVVPFNKMSIGELKRLVASKKSEKQDIKLKKHELIKLLEESE